MAEHKPKRHAIVDWVNDYWIEALLVALPLLSALAAVAYSDEFTSQFISNTDTRARARVWGIGAFGAIVIAQGIFGYLSLRRVKRISQLEERASQAEGWIQDIFAICQGHLYVLATRSTLQFEPTDRISLYAHDDKDGSFLLLGRFSLNETWREPGRKSYPGGEGCIGRTWTDEEHYVAEFPLRGDASFTQRCQEYHLGDEVARQLRMQSRFYYGWKIRNQTGDNGLAVLIIESTTARRYQLRALQDIFHGSAGFMLRQIVESISPRIPSLRVAQEAGF